MTPNDLQFNISHDPADLDALRPEWNDLMAARETYTLCETWEWMATWWQVYGEGRRLWLVTARPPSGELVGLIPLVDKLRKVGPIHWRELGLLGTDDVDPDHVDLLTQPGYEGAVVRGTLELLGARSREWDTIRLTSLHSESVHTPLLEQSGFPVRKITGPLCPYITLPDDWEIFYEGLGKDLRKKLRRYTNRLERDYPDQVTYRRVTDPDDLEHVLSLLMAYHQDRFEVRGTVGAFGTPARAAFHRAVTRRALDKGWMRLVALNVGGQDVAAIYTVQYGRRVCDYQSGFHPDFADYSPGHLMTAYSIRQAIEEGCTEYDLLRGAEGYKLRYAKEEPRRDIDLELIGSARARNRLAVVDAMSWGWSVAKRALPRKMRRSLKEAALEE